MTRRAGRRADAVAACVDRLVRPVSVVSARHGTAVHGMTVDSLSVVCSAPARLVLGVRLTSLWWQIASAAGGFAVSVLSAEQEDLARWFASRRRGAGAAQFDAVGWWASDYTRAPLLHGAATWYECAVETATPAGEQVIVTGLVVGEPGVDGSREVLLRADRAYRSLL